MNILKNPSIFYVQINSIVGNWTRKWRKFKTWSKRPWLNSKEREKSKNMLPNRCIPKTVFKFICVYMSIFILCPCSWLFSTPCLENLPFLTRAHAEQASGEHFLLSYARSGTNLTCCYLQVLTGKPIKFLFEEGFYLAENRLNVPLDYSKPILYRTHYPKNLKKIDNQSNKLIYVLRNWKECLYRHNYHLFKTPEDYLNFFKMNPIVIKEYMEGLDIFDHWNPEMRLLIHYEDILTNPMQIALQILQFFDEPIPESLTLQLLEKISKQTLLSYDKQHKASGGSHSKGQDPFFHTKDFSTEMLKEIDKIIQSNYSHLWEKYLKRYQS